MSDSVRCDHPHDERFLLCNDCEYERQYASLLEERTTEAEFQEALAALRAAGVEHDADDPIAKRYRSASDAVNHANRKREATNHRRSICVQIDGTD